MIPMQKVDPVFSKKRAGILLVAGVVVLALMRWYIYSDMQTLGPERYDVPIKVEHYFLTERDPELPKGVRPLVKIQVKSSKLFQTLKAIPLSIREEFEDVIPSSPWPQELVIYSYALPVGESWVAMGRYPVDSSLPASSKSFFTLDQDVLWAVGDGDLEVLGKAVATKARRVKQVTVTVEKMKVLGNAYLKFTMELLLGVFFVLTAFMLTKYFFIRKQTEGM
jgi:hypothetical protein